VAVHHSRVVLRNLLFTLTLILVWAVLYSDLLRLPHWDATFGSPPDRTLVLYAAVAAAGYMACESALLFLHRLRVYGRVFISKRESWTGFVMTALVFLILLISICEHCRGLLLAVPLCCLVRLLLSPRIDVQSSRFSRISTMLAEALLDAELVRRAIASVSSLGPVDKAALLNVTEIVASDARSITWECADLKRFLRLAEATLTCRLPVDVVDRILYDVLQQLGSRSEAPEQYCIFTTLHSGISHLWESSGLDLVIFIVASVLDGCIPPLQSHFIAGLTTSIVDEDKVHAVSNIAGYLGAYVLNLVCYSTLAYSYSALLARSTARMQRAVATKMLYMGAEDHYAYPPGSVNATFASDLTRLQDLWTGVTWQLLSPFARVVIAVVYAMHVSPQVGLLAITVFPLIFMTVPQSQSTRIAASHSVANADTIAMFQNGVACQRMIWSSDKQEEWQKSHLEPLIQDQQHKHIHMRVWGGVVQAYVQQLVNLFVAVHVAILGWLAVTGTLSVATFAGFVSLFASLGNPSISLGGFYRVALTCAGSAQRVDEFLGNSLYGPSDVMSIATKTDSDGCSDHPSTISGSRYEDMESGSGSVMLTQNSEKDIPSIIAPPRACTGDLVLQSVSFRYPNSWEPAIKDVSLEINAGEFVSLVGGSGCGKSTLLSLLMTWNQPSQGSITLGPRLGHGERLVLTPSTPAHDAAAQALRENTSVVFQDTMLINGTVRDNIAFSSHKPVTQADVEWAAAAAGCAKFIVSDLPQGYDTVLSNASLSGGQAQRICIARALCRKPTLLLLDEATSALDHDTEEQIMQTISDLRVRYPKEFGSLIVISITHHRANLKYADKVVYMSAGCIDSVQSSPGTPANRAEDYSRYNEHWLLGA